MTTQKPRKINLALQGGGAHGAYSWGVLDRLLEEESLEIEGISGTSAGAMNAAVLISGYARGGREGAKLALAQFWRTVSDLSSFSPLRKLPLEHLFNGWNLDWSPAYYALDLASRLFSPYDLNPFNFNPLKPVLDEIIDLKALQHCSDMKLFVTATHVESGQPRVFSRDELTIDVLLASACIPSLFQAVEIDGEHYWDGGYMGNPAIWPLIYHTRGEDIMLVQINPLHREGVPKTALEIINRLNEISFNSSLVAEMRAIDFVKRLIKEGKLSHEHYKDLRLHLVYSPKEMHELNASSKVNSSWEFLRWLHSVGYDAAEQWLRQHRSAIGVRSSLNIREKFLKGPARHRAATTPIPPLKESMEQKKKPSPPPAKRKKKPE